MFIELVDALRCTVQHSDTYLVAAPGEMVDRDIISGVLGCPVCNAEYRIIDGVVDFGDGNMRASEPRIGDREFEALRCAALLDLQGSGGYAVLAGEWGALAPALLDAISIHLLLVNPPASVTHAAGLSIILAKSRAPLVKQRARGVALDSSSAANWGMEAAAALVTNGGRLVAPSGASLPVNARLLVSDEHHWVAEVSHPVLARIMRRREAGSSDCANEYS